MEAELKGRWLEICCIYGWNLCSKRTGEKSLGSTWGMPH